MGYLNLFMLYKNFIIAKHLSYNYPCNPFNQNFQDDLL